MPQLHGATLAALLAEQQTAPSTDHRAWLASQLESPQISAESSWLRPAVRWFAQGARGLPAPGIVLAKPQTARRARPFPPPSTRPSPWPS